MYNLINNEVTFLMYKINNKKNNKNKINVVYD